MYGLLRPMPSSIPLRFIGFDVCIQRFFFTLPSYKSIPVSRGDDSNAATIAQQSSQLNGNATRWAQVSPETQEARAVDAPVSKFSRIEARPLGSPGVCKVLLVDDSRVNINVLKKMLHRVSATWLPRSPVTVNCGSTSDHHAGKEYDRSSVSMVLEEEPIPPSIAAKSVRLDYSEADDGTVAVKMVQEASEAGSPFDVVFMDNVMILMHGPEAAKAMRAVGFEGLIIGVTGNVMMEDINQYIASGADCVLGKPVDLEDLKQILDRLTH